MKHQIGDGFSTSLRMHPNIFNILYVKLLIDGEYEIFFVYNDMTFINSAANLFLIVMRSLIIGDDDGGAHLNIFKLSYKITFLRITC